MNTKHTPGPWTANEPNEKALRYAWSVWPEEGSGFARIATVTQCDEQEANAHLIAAAPDLLEALYQIATYDPTKWDAVTLGNIAREAIVKATCQQ